MHASFTKTDSLQHSSPSKSTLVAPVCQDTEVTVIGASLDETLKVRCHVSADPSDVTFIWQFNNSGESFDVPPQMFTPVPGNVSELNYIPASQRDYGTLTCWGHNTIGRQTEPCVFQVVPACKLNYYQILRVFKVFLQNFS